jgi:hypothetical protein
MIEKYTFSNAVKSYKKKYQTENYHEEEDDTCIGGLAVFIIFFIILIAVSSLMIYWKTLPDWAKAFGLLSLLNDNIGGPIGTLIIVYIAKGSGTLQGQNLNIVQGTPIVEGTPI